MKKISIAILLGNLFAIHSAAALATEYYARVDFGYATSQYNVKKNTGYNNMSAWPSAQELSTMRMANYQGYVASFGGGYYYTDSIRFEGSLSSSMDSVTKKMASDNLSTTSVNLNAGDLSTLTDVKSKLKDTTYIGMVNAYYDLIGYKITPYVTVGAGFIAKQAKVSTSGTATNTVTASQSAFYDSYKFKNKIGFAYQVGLGMGHPISKLATVDAGYKYTANSLMLTSKTRSAKIKSAAVHNVTVGIRLTF